MIDPHIIAGLVTLIVLEVVLGIDNLIFIAILADRLPPHQRDRARITGLSLAMFMRLGLLAGISWLVGLTSPLFSLAGFDFSGRDLILAAGGLFLLFKATTEIHERLEGGAHASGKVRGHAGFAAVIAQIIVLDAVFSLDSVITAVGMVEELWVMMLAVVIAMVVMIVASKPLTTFVNRHPTVVMLCLAFLLMIGLSLIAEAFHLHIPKGYIYAAIAFSILVEAFNQIRLAREKRRMAQIPLRQRTADAVLRLLGSQFEPDAEPARTGEGAERAGDEPGFEETEREMIVGVLRLGSRTTRSIMTPRQEVGWIDINADNASILATLQEHGHARYLVCDGRLEDLEGVVQARDLLPDLVAGRPVDIRAHMQPALVVHDRLPVARLIEQLKEAPSRLAVVADDHGNIDGVVTPTDVLAAIAGSLVEEEDASPRPERLDNGAIRFDAMTSIEEAADLLHLPAMADDNGYTTVAGFVLGRLGRIPQRGDRFDFEGWRFTVEEMDGRRIVTVLATPAEGE